MNTIMKVGFGFTKCECSTEGCDTPATHQVSGGGEVSYHCGACAEVVRLDPREAFDGVVVPVSVTVGATDGRPFIMGDDGEVSFSREEWPVIRSEMDTMLGLMVFDFEDPGSSIDEAVLGVSEEGG